MNNKKAQMNQVFVYIMSIMVILFVGFLVTKFIMGYTEDTGAIVEQKFFERLEKDYRDVYKRYGSEEIVDYRVTSKVKNICFSKTPTCDFSSFDLPIEASELEILFDTSNIGLFDKDGVLTAKNIGEFEVEGSGCFCIGTESSKFTLKIENKKNTVWISEVK